MRKLKIKTSNDITIKYSELCDCDELYIVRIAGVEFWLSYRFWSKMVEPLIWLFDVDGIETDKLICTTKKLSKTKKLDVLKSAFIAYMVGNGMLEIVE